MLLQIALLPLAMLQGAGQVAREATLSFHFERAGLTLPEYTLSIRNDGTGTFDGSFNPPTVSRYSVAAASPAQPLSAAFVLPPATVVRLFSLAEEAQEFSQGCESKAKHIADTGQKTLTFLAGARPSSCTYNYTEQKPVAALAERFMAMAYTLEAGEKLKLKHRFDRLGLDAEMKNLVDAAREGRAQELELIAPVLRSLVEDGQLMDRVHQRAQQLLDLAAAPYAESAR